MDKYIVTCTDPTLNYELTAGNEYEVIEVIPNQLNQPLYVVVNDLGQTHVYSKRRFK